MNEGKWRHFYLLKVCEVWNWIRSTITNVRVSCIGKKKPIIYGDFRWVGGRTRIEHVLCFMNFCNWFWPNFYRRKLWEKSTTFVWIFTAPCSSHCSEVIYFEFGLWSLEKIGFGLIHYWPCAFLLHFFLCLLYAVTCLSQHSLFFIE